MKSLILFFLFIITPCCGYEMFGQSLLREIETLYQQGHISDAERLIVDLVTRPSIVKNPLFFNRLRIMQATIHVDRGQHYEALRILQTLMTTEVHHLVDILLAQI